MIRSLPLFLLAAALVTRAQDPLPRTPNETIKALNLPAGFKATLFAGEPDIAQPISFCFDARGRLWVAECISYPNWTGKEGQDRIVILEDTDHDGHFAKRTLFYDKLNYVTGIEVGFGGVYIAAAPNLLFIPDKDGDDKPDGPPQILLEGFGHQGGHNLVNGFVWGPDGWLWGGHGGSSSGNIGAPESKDTDRTFFDGGVWRYHPTKKIFEPVMEGTTNPWGLDFDAYGQAFISNSVTPHLYHVIPASHVERRRQSPSNRYAYTVIDTIADHKHYAGADWTKSRTGSAELGGGHAHCGLMVYQGDNWPDKYRNSVFINNIHGDRMNNDLPQRRGSGYTASHGPDFLTSADPWYFALHMKTGPDGAVYLSDWYDTGECHTRKPHTENGRIYKISYGDPKPPTIPDVSKLTSAQLVDLQLHKNDWWARQARRALQERGQADVATSVALSKILNEDSDIPHRLRALWAMQVTGATSEKLLLDLLKDPSEYLRAWAIRLLAEDRSPTPAALTEFTQLAAADPSPWVRLHLASAATRLTLDQREPILKNLLTHEEDQSDQNLPQMYWYALEPIAATDPKRALALALAGKLPKLREYTTRRIADAAKVQPEPKTK